MKMFLRLGVFVFLSIAFLLVVGTAEGQQPSLEVFPSTGDQPVDIGDPIQAAFVVGPADSVALYIEARGMNITSIVGATATVNPIVPGTYSTDADTGSLVVRGTLEQEVGAFISATWEEIGKQTTVFFNGIHVGIRPATIVVNPPDPEYLAVGDIFTQMIEIRDITDLTGWQMDIAFNPGVLEVVDISAGDFLEQDGEDAQFFYEHSPGKIAVRQVRIGGIDAPLSGVSGSGVLVALTFRFVSFSEALLGLHNVRLSDSSGERLSYSVNLTPVVATHISTAAEDINQDGMVDILDLVVAASSIGSIRPNLRADVNGDGIVDVLDLVAIAGSSHWGRSVHIIQVREPNVAAPASSVLNLMPDTIRKWIALAHVRNDGSLVFQRGIANLESLLASRVPSETRLLLNYPNPFNPETWIPYQLSESADVTVSIYSVNGSLIRTLALGHQAAGLYRSRSRAAYWDGRNAFGERVASGLYFYTLTAGDFTATRKMLIRK